MEGDGTQISFATLAHNTGRRGLSWPLQNVSGGEPKDVAILSAQKKSGRLRGQGKLHETGEDPGRGKMGLREVTKNPMKCDLRSDTVCAEEGNVGDDGRGSLSHSHAPAAGQRRLGDRLRHLWRVALLDIPEIGVTLSPNNPHPMPSAGNTATISRKRDHGSAGRYRCSRSTSAT